MKIKLFIILFFLLASPLFAAPGKPTVSGTYTHGSTNVTISGSSFGTKTTAAPNLWDTVENISAYSGLSNGASIPTGSPYPYDHPDASSTTLSNYCNASGDQRSTRSTSCYKRTGYQNMLSRMDHPITTGTLYASWWFRSDQDMSDQAGWHSTKFLRVSPNVGDFSVHTSSWAITLNFISDDGGSSFCGGVHWDTFYPPPNAWHFFEIMYDSTNANYIVKMDNSTIGSHSFAATTCASQTWSNIWILGVDDSAYGDGSVWENMTSWIDDVYIDGTQAHVVIGNANTYSSCTHLEMQPPSSWSASSIGISSFNAGSFTNGTTVYLYVIDSSGAVSPASDGFQIGGDTTPPSALTGSLGGSLQ